MKKVQRGHLFGDTNHDDKMVQSYFSSDRFFENELKAKRVKHLMLELGMSSKLQIPINKLVEEGVSPSAKEQFTKNYREIFNAKPDQYAEADLRSGYLLAIVEKATKHGIKVHMLDDAHFPEFNTSDPIVRHYQSRIAAGQTIDPIELKSVNKRYRHSNEPAYAKRVVDAAKGQDFAIVRGNAHIQNAEGLVKQLKKYSISISTAAVYPDKNTYHNYVKDFFGASELFNQSKEIGIPFNRVPDRIIFADGGESNPSDSHKKIAKNTERFTNTWPYSLFGMSTKDPSFKAYPR